MPRRVLVVSTVEHGDEELQAHVGEADEVKVVVPVVRQGVLDWLANDEKAFGRAQEVAERTAERLPGETVETVAAEPDIGMAIRDALATFPADEIVVAVRPTDQEGAIESVATKSHANSLTGWRSASRTGVIPGRWPSRENYRRPISRLR
jgi:hypothetical protein